MYLHSKGIIIILMHSIENKASLETSFRTQRTTAHTPSGTMGIYSTPINSDVGIRNSR